MGELYGLMYVMPEVQPDGRIKVFVDCHAVYDNEQDARLVQRDMFNPNAYQIVRLKGETDTARLVRLRAKEARDA